MSRVPKARIDAAPSSGEGFGNFRAPGAARAEGASDSAHAAGKEAPGESPDTQGSSVRRAREGLRSWLHDTFPGHENAVIWGFVGFLVALLFFIIGFWRTLVVVLLVVVGVAFGQVLDGDPKIINTVRGLFGGDDAR